MGGNIGVVTARGERCACGMFVLEEPVCPYHQKTHAIHILLLLMLILLVVVVTANNHCY